MSHTKEGNLEYQQTLNRNFKAQSILKGLHAIDELQEQIKELELSKKALNVFRKGPESIGEHLFAEGCIPKGYDAIELTKGTDDNPPIRAVRDSADPENLEAERILTRQELEEHAQQLLSK